MRKTAALILMSFFCLGMPVCVFGFDCCDKTQGGTKPAYVAGELLVKYKPSIRTTASARYQNQYGISALRTFSRIGVQHVRLPGDMTVEDALEVYKDDPDVEYAEPNYYRYITAMPNDSEFGKLWGLNNTGQSVNGTYGTNDADIDAPEAWDIATGSGNVIVAVIDTGVDYNHPDISENIWMNLNEIAENGIDDDNNGYIDDIRGWDFFDDDINPMDSDDHGTHVAGIIAAKGNNSMGVTGVCWNARIMPLRTLNSDGGTIADEIDAIFYAIENGADIINASFGSTDYSQTEYDAISAAKNAGILFVASAGNDGVSNDVYPDYPASYDLENIISVAATDQDDNLAEFSNYGINSVHVAAPGTNIYSTKPGRETVWSDNFDDNDISDWLTGGTSSWGLSTTSFSGPYSVTDSPEGNYQDNTTSWLRSPVIDLSSHADARLEFKYNGIGESYQIGNAIYCYDYLAIEASTNGTDYVELDFTCESTEGEWYDMFFDLSAYDGISTLYIRFLFESDESYTFDGWYIDDVAITVPSASASSYDGTEYQYMGGTSMAAPHVSGLAALIKAYNPTLTGIEIKDIIMNTVDAKPSLAGKIITGGRINAYNALDATPQSNPLYFPHSDTTSGWETEIAAINTSSTQTASGTLNGYSDQGVLIETIPITLNPHARSQITISEEFTNHSSIKYLILNSNTDTIKGYTKFYVQGTYRVAVPAVNNINTSDIYISHIDSSTDWWTGISLLNTTSSGKTATIQFNTGETKDITLSSNQHTAFTIASLFGQSRPDIQSAKITNASGIIGLELFGSTQESGNNYLSGILLKDSTTQTIYYPHIASDDTWWTGIVAYNPSSSSSTLTITPYTEEGEPLETQTKEIDPMGKYIGTISSLLLPSGTAWLKIDSTNPITGFELFGTNNGNQLAGYTGVGISGKQRVFAKLDINNNNWTGIAFVNIEATQASVTLTAYDNNGTSVASRTIPLGGYAKMVDEAQDLFTQDISSATYISYSSDKDIVGFQLNGSPDNMMLDGLPGM